MMRDGRISSPLKPQKMKLLFRSNSFVALAESNALPDVNIGARLHLERPTSSLTVSAIVFNESFAKRLCSLRAKGEPSLIRSLLGREKARMSYQTESSSLCHSIVKRSSPHST